MYVSRSCVRILTPFRNLFPTLGPDSNAEKLDMKLDTSIESESSNSKYAANDHAFGWYIMSGPEIEFSSVSKRDGSHLEFFDCDNTAGEERQTIKVVCTDSSENSNCDHISKGGVEATVVEMPEDCGPGRYAVAWSMEPSTNHDHIRDHFEKRGLSDSSVFDFTFDYDSTHFEKRADSNVLLRIDYSDDPGYWQTIVADAPGSKTSSKRKRQIEVDTHFGGDHKAWLEQNWHIEKRTLQHQEIHARWFSGDLKEWWDRQRNVDVKYDGVRHDIKVRRLPLES
jgi:chitinase